MHQRPSINQPFLIASIVGLLVIIISISMLRQPQSYPVPIQDTPTTEISDIPPDFNQTPWLWSHTETPAQHEIALFRCHLDLNAPMSNAYLEIFADTRYAAWSNGTFLGRGPVRFSHVRREYDQYLLGNLSSGSHLIAVLVQWAPNFRRSESFTPNLQARIIDHTKIITFDTTNCVTESGHAWNTTAAPIHAGNILGPTEHLDLRQLPSNWNQVGFNDAQWASTQIQTPSKTDIIYQPRSIQPLINVPMIPNLKTSGKLAPEAWVGELIADENGQAQYQFTLEESTTITIQALSNIGQPELDSLALLDEQTLMWDRLEEHPDRYHTNLELGKGEHTLRISGMTAGDSWVFSITHEYISSDPPPLGGGAHAGRRLLLPDMQADTNPVGSNPTPTSLNLAFDSEPSYAIIDLGRTVHGRLEATITGAPGTIVDIGWDERLWQAYRPLPYPGSLHPEWDQTDSWVLSDTPRQITTIDARAGRYIMIAVWATTPTAISNLQVFEERYPLTQHGSLQTGNPRLDHIWQVGVDTLLPSMNDGYVDPWRERGQWWGDAHIADQSNKVVFNDSDLLRHGLLQMADSAGDHLPTAFTPSGSGLWMLDYDMYWVLSMYDYGQRTGDWDFIQQFYPKIVYFMNYLEGIRDPQTGLIDLYQAQPAMIYIDSGSYWDRRGQSTAINAFYYGTLLQAAAIADQLGQQEDATIWREQAAQLRIQANQLLYRPSEGHYISGIDQDQIHEPTPQSQAIALAFGLVPDGEEDRVADSLLSMLGTPDEPKVHILGSYMVLKGLGRVGRIDDAIQFINQFFGSMIDHGATTWWENFIANRKYAESLSHAWGSSPTWFLSTYLLGARQTSPTAWEVAIPDIIWPRISGVIPISEANGNLSVAWARETCDQLQIEIDSPNGTSGIVTFTAAPDQSTIWMNGTIIWPRKEETPSISYQDGAFQLHLSDGRYQIDLQSTQPCP